MDNGLLLGFKREIGRVSGNHRIIGHAWPLDGSIPQTVLDRLEEANPGRKKDMMVWWGKESKRLTDKMAQATGLPKQQAQALAGIAWNLHLLGNRMPENTLVQWVLAPPADREEPRRQLHHPLQGAPRIRPSPRAGIARYVAGGGERSRPVGADDGDLAASPLSEMLLRRRGRTLAKHGIAFTGNEEDTGRLELFLDMWESSPSDDRLP